MEFHRPLQSSPARERAHALVRGVAEPWERDRQMAPDIAAVSRLIQKGGFAGLCPAV